MQRPRFACLLLLLALPGASFAQLDLSGKWNGMFHEDQPERVPGPELGDNLGLPINAAARLAGETWDATILTLPAYQCRVHPSDYGIRGPALVHIWSENDRATQQIVAWHTHITTWEVERTIWMDGRPHPPEYALFTSQGFSTGKWDGDILTITTDHLKRGWIRRNGIPRSAKAVVTEHLIRHGDYLTWTTIVNDPAYLTEPFIRTTDFAYAPNNNMTAYPCESVEEVVGRPEGYFPHHLPGTNKFLPEFGQRFNIPFEATQGGAQTMYPEYREKLKAMMAQQPKPQQAAK